MSETNKNFIPKQKLKRSKKTKQWGIDSLEGYINQSTFVQSSKSDLLRFYEAYNGELAEADYNYVTNPYNSQAGKKRNFPAKLRNYNILKPVVDLLLGEKSQRPSNYQVTVSNPDAVSRMEEEKQKQVLANLEQMFINELKRMGFDTGMEDGEAQTPEQVELSEEFVRRGVAGQPRMELFSPAMWSDLPGPITGLILAKDAVYLTTIGDGMVRLPR